MFDLKRGSNLLNLNVYVGIRMIAYDVVEGSCLCQEGLTIYQFRVSQIYNIGMRLVT